MKMRQRAKDIRRQKHRRGTAIAVAIVGGGAAFFIGRWLYRKIVTDAPPAPQSTKDWSGCWEPPDWVQPKPKYKCNDIVVADVSMSPTEERLETDYIDGRTWSPISGTNVGMWVYELRHTRVIAEESNIELA